MNIKTKTRIKIIKAILTIVFLLSNAECRQWGLYDLLHNIANAAGTAGTTPPTPLILTGQVSTYAGDQSGSDDGFILSAAATYNNPTGIYSDGANLYVADKLNHTIRKVVIATGDVTTFAGSAGISGNVDDIGTAARFFNPSDITSDGTNLYVADSGNNTIRKIVISTGLVSTFAGGSAITTGNCGGILSTTCADGSGNAARFNNPNGITSYGTNLYVIDFRNYTIRQIDLLLFPGNVTTLAGMAGIIGGANGPGLTATFTAPQGITADGANLYITDSSLCTIRQITFAGVVSTIAGTSGTCGYMDGTGIGTMFNFPMGITFVGGSLFVVDMKNNYIRRYVIATGAINTLAPFTGDYITTDGFSLFMTNTGNHFIKSMVIANPLLSFVISGIPGVSGSTDGSLAATFNSPYGIASDGTSFYVADSGNNTIRKIVASTGIVTKFAGFGGNPSWGDGFASLL